jgi:OTU domain-containing protein 3
VRPRCPGAPRAHAPTADAAPFPAAPQSSARARRAPGERSAHTLIPSHLHPTDRVRPQATDSDPTANTAQLTAQLRALGLYAAPTLGDGNCLFRALSDQLHGTPAHHAQLRSDVCAWIARHAGRYAPFCEDERGLAVHLECMRAPATYGGHMELSAFAHMTGRDVKVVQPGLVYVIEHASFDDGPEDAAPTQEAGLAEDAALPSREQRKLRRERVRADKERSRADKERDVLAAGSPADDDADAAPGPIYVA